MYVNPILPSYEGTRLPTAIICFPAPLTGSNQASPQPSLGGPVPLRPSLTSSVVDPFQAAAEIAAAQQQQQQQMFQSTAGSGSGLVCPSRVSDKIQQLVNTLKRPKRRPLPEYFIDEDDQILVQPVVDPNAPKPLGAPTEPLVGEKLIVSSARNLRNCQPPGL